MTKQLPDHRSKAVGIGSEASNAVKKVCLEYGIPSSEVPDTIEALNRVVSLFDKYVALRELESRSLSKSRRLLTVLQDSCGRVSNSLGMMSHQDRVLISRVTGVDLMHLELSAKKISRELVVKDVVKKKQEGEGRKDEKEARPFNPKRFLIRSLAEEWIAAGKGHPKTYHKGGEKDFQGEFYDFICRAMKAANLKPPGGDTIRDEIATI